MTKEVTRTLEQILNDAYDETKQAIRFIASGTLVLQGGWDATTNTPALASGVGIEGYYYVVAVDGSTNLDGVTDWKVGDWAIFGGGVWFKADHTDQVSSVHGRVGAVVAASGDYDTDLVDNNSLVAGVTTSDALNNLLAGGLTKKGHDYIVSDADGDDSKSGSVNEPLKTLAQAITLGKAAGMTTVAIKVDESGAGDAGIVTILGTDPMVSIEGIAGIGDWGSGIPNIQLAPLATLFINNLYVSNIKQTSFISGDRWLIIEECFVGSITDDVGGDPTDLNIYASNMFTPTANIARVLNAKTLYGTCVDENTGKFYPLKGLDMSTLQIENVLDPSSPQHADTQAARDAAIATHTAIAAAHHAKYTDGEAGIVADTKVTAHVALPDPHTQYQLESEKDAANGYAGLDASSKINPAQLPAIAITDTFVVASQAAMLALTAETGDVAIRTDLPDTFILQGTDPTVLGDWVVLEHPDDVVTSVHGRTGVVTGQNGDYIASQVTNTPAGTVAAVTVQAAINELDSEKATPADITADIATHTAIDAAHHAKYTDPEAVTAMGVKGDANSLNHDRYLDSEAVSAMGVKGDANPLNHDQPVFGTEFASAESTGESTHTGDVAKQTKTSIVMTSPPSGNYLLQWSCQLSGDDENKQFQADLYDGASIIDECDFTPKKKWGDANESYPKFGGSLVVALSATTTFSLRYATNDAGKTVAIKNARMQIWRVS